jgi:hypothetical protein
MNAPNKQAATPVLVWKGHEHIVRALSSLGAAVITRICGKATPIHIAAARGHRRLIRVLQSHGADVNRRNDRGWHPSSSRHSGVTRQWSGRWGDARGRVQARWDAAARDRSAEGHEPVVRALHGLGADVNAWDE